jgi:hypothetical protein
MNFHSSFPRFIDRELQRIVARIFSLNACKIPAPGFDIALVKRIALAAALEVDGIETRLPVLL